MRKLKDRIKKIRKDMGLTMEKFGEPLGMKKSSISQIESGTNKPSNQTINLICVVYNINKEWLLTGEGPQYTEKTREQEITEFLVKAQEGDISPLKMKLIRIMARLPEEDWEKLEIIAKKMVDICSEEE